MQGVIVSFENYQKRREKKQQCQGLGFHRSDLKPSANCCNVYSYGCICVKCGKCGRKF